MRILRTMIRIALSPITLIIHLIVAILNFILAISSSILGIGASVFGLIGFLMLFTGDRNAAWQILLFAWLISPLGLPAIAEHLLKLFDGLFTRMTNAI